MATSSPQLTLADLLTKKQAGKQVAINSTDNAIFMQLTGNN
jgi:hypothetical protein